LANPPDFVAVHPSHHRSFQLLVEAPAFLLQIAQKTFRHCSRPSIEVAQRSHNIVVVKGVIDIRRVPERGLIFDCVSIGCPGRENGPFHFGFELRVMHYVERTAKIGEGHGFTSFLPILCLLGSTGGSRYQSGWPAGCPKQYRQADRLGSGRVSRLILRAFDTIVGRVVADLDTPRFHCLGHDAFELDRE
jgi:hypothetical protein